MKIIKLGCLLGGLLMSNSAFSNEKSIHIISDNSFGFTKLDEKSAERIQKGLISYLFDKGRRDDEMTLKFIDTQYGWLVADMPPSELGKGGAVEILKKLPFKKNACADLVAAFKQLTLQNKITKADEIYIVVFSPLFHTTDPCNGKWDPFAKMPDEIDANEILQDKRIKKILFLGSSDEQSPQWVDAFFDVASARNIDFEIVGLAQAEGELKRKEWSWPK